MVSALNAAEISALSLKGAAFLEPPPTLAQALDAVESAEGRSALFIEIKDRSGDFSTTDGRLEARVAELVAGRSAPIAVMSFNPFSVARMAADAPNTPRGLVSGGFSDALEPQRRAELEGLAAFEAVEASFTSYHWRALSHEAVARLRSTGAPILSWTLRSSEEAAHALQHCDQITFEGFRP